MSVTQSSSRIRLRAVEPGDVDMMYALEGDSDLWLCSGTTSPYSREALRRYVDQCTNDIYTDKQLRMVAEVDGVPVGCVDLFDFNPMHRRAEVGVAILPKWRGKGLGQEAIRMIGQFAYRHLALVQLYAVVSVDNTSAADAFLHSGYKKTATLSNWVAAGAGRMTDGLLFQYVF